MLRNLDNKDRVTIIVDLCNQHMGSIDDLKKMALEAWLSGADVVKLQLMDSEKHFGVTNKKYRDVEIGDWLEIVDFCEQNGIPLMASVFDEERLGWLENADIPAYKIASRTVKEDVTLCKNILDKQYKTLISTGACKENEFPFIYSKNSKYIKYMYCVSEYPTKLDSENFNMPKEFKEDGYIGYSDHTIGIAAPLLAVTRGAKIIEKHYTLNSNYNISTEGAHMCSFTKDSLKLFRNLVDELVILK